MVVDILAIGAHPDDVELGCCGTIINHIENGGSAGIIDLTEGELGTRGTVETRYREAADAAAILKVSFRENLKLADGFFRADKESLLELVKRIRKYRPKIVLANAMKDRHPDHGRGGHFISEACFLSGLIKVETEFEGIKQEAWRPKVVYHYVQDYYTSPDIVVDITTAWEKKLSAIKAFKTQFFTGEEDESLPVTPISSKDFLDFIESRAREWGRPVGITFGEAFTTERVPGVKDITGLI